MRFKVAEVLVHTGDQYVAPLSDVEPASQQIVEQHKRLWAVTVYAPASTTPQQGDAVLAFLGDRMGIRFVGSDGHVVPPVDEVAVDAVISKYSKSARHRAAILELAPAAKDEGRLNFTSLVELYELSARQHGYIPKTRSRSLTSVTSART